MRLSSTLGGGILASYPLVSPTTEAYIAPHSLHFGQLNTSKAFAGADGVIAVFDITRPGEGPVEKMRTGRKRRARNGLGGRAANADGVKGIISAMDTNCDGVLAAGTFGRGVGLYGDHGHGECDAMFSIAEYGEGEAGTKGTGVTQVIWSAEGRYLCVVERGSDGVGVWDVRGTGKRLAWLKGRKAVTQQRMGVDVMNGEVWAGGSDGFVRVWEGLGLKGGVVEPGWGFDAHGDVASGVGLHPGGSVVATCSGQRHFPTLEWWDVDKDEGRDIESASGVGVKSIARLAELGFFTQRNLG